MATFDELLLQEYQRWRLYLHQDQCYLGRAYLWLKRPGTMQRFSLLETRDWGEMRKIMLAYELVLGELWKPGHMNYAWLGNDFATHEGHGHMHLIPRYVSPIEFAGATFVDGRWGKNYAPYRKQVESDPMLFKIRDAIRQPLRTVVLY